MSASSASYRVVDPASDASGVRLASATLGIGLDDPTLASRIPAGALDPSGRPLGAPLTYQVLAGEEPGAAASEKPQPATGTRGRPPGRLVRGLIGLAAGGAGAASGYLLARKLGLQPASPSMMLQTAAGGLLGLLLAWVALRWNHNRR